MTDSKRRTLYINSLRDIDHRTLFSIEEVEAAYALDFDAEQAKSFASETMDGPITPGKPAFFAEHLLGLLSRLSPDVARRVRIAGGVSN